MDARIVFRSRYRAHVIDDDTLALRSERGPEVLTGPGLGAIARLIDGRRSIEQVLAGVRRRVDAPTALYMIEDLIGRAVLATGRAVEPARPMRVGALTRMLALGPGARRVAAVRSHWIGRAWPAAPAWKATAGNRARGTLDVVVVDDYLRGELAHVNAHALESRRRWLLVQPWGEIAWIGPLFEPGSSACWECLAHRLRGHRVVEAWLARRDRRWPAPVPLMGTTESAVAVMSHVVRHASLTRRTDSPLRGHLLRLDLLNGRWSAHAIRRRPQCPACGAPGRSPSTRAKPSIDNAARRSDRVGSGGTPRNPFPHLTDPITGVIEAITIVERPSWPSVCLTIAPTATHRLNLTFARAWRSQIEPASGKGFSAAEAIRSAAGEGVERFCGEYEGTEARLTSTLGALGDRAMDPRDVMLFSDAQYASAGAGFRAGDDGVSTVPRRFDARASMEWTPVWSLTQRRERYLPTACLYYGHPDTARLGMCRADSNGCAAGATTAHALYRGLLELIERDAVAIWWYNRIRRPSASLAVLAGSRARGLVRDCRRNGRDVWLLDLTIDVEVPVYAALSARRRGLPRIAFGFGADLNPRQAAVRAMAEMGQVLATTQGEGVDDDTLAPAIADWFRRGTLRRDPYVVPKGRAEARRGSQPRSHAAACRVLQRRLERRGLEVLCLSQTRPDVGVPVMRAIVPGLRHFWPRFAPGRLFDVPVSMGWREAPVPEAELNPTAFFL